MVAAASGTYMHLVNKQQIIVKFFVYLAEVTVREFKLDFAYWTTPITRVMTPP